MLEGTDDYICIQLSKEDLDEADKRKEDGYKGSFTNGKGAIYGAIGELCVEKTYPHLIRKNTIDYDFISPNGVKVEVKTHSCNSLPSLDHGASINTGYRQKCNFYIFVRVKKDFSCCWLIGFKDVESFFEDAKFIPEGSPRPSGGTYQIGCFDLDYKFLDKMPHGNTNT